MLIKRTFIVASKKRRTVGQRSKVYGPKTTMLEGRRLGDETSQGHIPERVFVMGVGTRFGRQNVPDGLPCSPKRRFWGAWCYHSQVKMRKGRTNISEGFGSTFCSPNLVLQSLKSASKTRSEMLCSPNTRLFGSPHSSEKVWLASARVATHVANKKWRNFAPTT